MSYPKLYLKNSSGVSGTYPSQHLFLSTWDLYSGLCLLELTWNCICGNELRSLGMYFLWFVLTSIAEHLHNTCPVHANLLKNLKTFFEVFRSAACQGDPESYGIFDGLSATLSLVLIGSAGYVRIGLDERLRGSIGCAASPIRTSFPLCQEGIGARKRSGHCLTSFAFLTLEDVSSFYHQDLASWGRIAYLKTARTEGWKSEYIFKRAEGSTWVCQSRKLEVNDVSSVTTIISLE